MPKATGQGLYRVTLTARCEAIVEVEAHSKNEALALARGLEYDGMTSEFEPVDWGKVRAVPGSAHIVATPVEMKGSDGHL